MPELSIPISSSPAYSPAPNPSAEHNHTHPLPVPESTTETLEAFSENYRTPQFGSLGEYRKHVDRLIDDSSEAMTVGLKHHLDNLLIFAALFSAINAGVLVYWLPQLTIGPSDETNKLLRLLVHRADNTTLTETVLSPPAFFASAADVRINRFLSISLTISLLASFGTLLAQQWLSHFTRRSHGSVHKEHWEKRRKLDGAERWHLETIVELVLPGIMQAALVIFLVGLIELLGSLNSSVAAPNLVLAALGGGAFIISIALSIWDPYCPFQTSIPHILSYPARIFPVHIFGLAYDSISYTFARIQRPPESSEVLEAKTICTILETSEDMAVVVDTVKNVPLLSEPAALEILGKSPTVLPHLTHIGPLNWDPLRSIAFPERAAAHLLAAAPGTLERAPWWLLDHRQLSATARYCLEDPTHPLSLLPSSFTTVSLMVFVEDLYEELGLPESITKYLDYVCATFRNSAEASRIIIIRMMAWNIYSRILCHPTITERCHDPESMPSSETFNSLKESLSKASKAHKEFQRRDTMKSTAFLNVHEHMLRAFKAYGAWEPSPQHDGRPQSSILYLDRLAYCILKGIRAIISPGVADWGTVSRFLQLADPLLPGQQRLNSKPAISPGEDSDFWRKHQCYRDQVFEEMLDLVDYVLKAGAEWMSNAGRMERAHLAPPQYSPIRSSDVRVLTRYMRMLTQRSTTASSSAYFTTLNAFARSRTPGSEVWRWK